MFLNYSGIDALKSVLYQCCLKMTQYIKRKQQPLVGRKVPKSYILAYEYLENKAKELTAKNEPLFLQQGDFVKILESVPNKGFELTSSEELINGRVYKGYDWLLPIFLCHIIDYMYYQFVILTITICIKQISKCYFMMLVNDRTYNGLNCCCF